MTSGRGWIPVALSAALIVGCLVALFLLWVLAVRRFYRLHSERPAKRMVRCADGWELAVFHRAPAVRRFEEPVLLVHGLAANHYTFDFDPPYSLAHVLAGAGFECFSVDLRGTGSSRRPPRGRRSQWTVDDHVTLDAPALIGHALEATGASRVLWVGHSLGGLIGYAVAQGPAAKQLAGMVALGSPVRFRFAPWLKLALGLGVITAWPFNFRQTLVSIALAPFLGYVNVPLSSVVANTRHIEPRVQRQVYAHLMSTMGHRVLAQFADWVAHDAFRSRDRKVDWRAGLANLSLPLLVMGGRADRLAPPEALEAQYALAGSEDKRLVILGTPEGMGMDYGHGDLLYGSGVPTEVHPRILAWLREHATPLSSDLGPDASGEVSGQQLPDR